MGWLKRDIWKAGFAIAGMVLLLVLMVWVPVSAAGASERTSEPAMPVTGTVQATPTEDATVTALNKEKLQHENDWWWSFGATILTSVISTLTLALAGLFTVVRYFNDRRDAREKQEEEAKRLAEERKAERERRDEGRFQAVVASLGSNNIEAKAGAVIMLRTFLLPGYEQFYRQAFDLAVTHLRLRHVDPNTSAPLDPSEYVPPDSLSLALITVFKESFPLARNALVNQKKSPFDPQILDASRIRLDNAFLAWSDLKGVWMRGAFLIGAYLRGADLREARLGRADLRGADLHEAKLSKARLFKANLSKAHLERADLREADLRGAVLNATHLNGADLNGADLGGVHLNGADLRGVKGLTKEQKEACKAQGAIIDEDSATSASQSPVSPSPPSQSNKAQPPSAPPAQGSTLTSGTDGSSATSSKLGSES